jgi:hypothetical protein
MCRVASRCRACRMRRTREAAAGGGALRRTRLALFWLCNGSCSRRGLKCCRGRCHVVRLAATHAAHAHRHLSRPPNHSPRLMKPRMDHAVELIERLINTWRRKSRPWVLAQFAGGESEIGSPRVVLQAPRDAQPGRPGEGMPSLAGPHLEHPGPS